MQSRLTILLLSACIVLFSQVQAACLCDASDTTCLQKCVNDGQACVTGCSGDNACYDQCIANFWPGQTVASSTGVTSAVAATSTTAASVAATTSVAASTSAPVAQQSSVAQSASSVLASVASSASAVVSSASSSLGAAASSAASFTPTPPSTSSAPSTTSGGQSTYLIPAVAIGVASVTVITQFFFLARMGSVLFN
ncbi:uncharacterized protein EV154DRAFT_490527 [Mucor mucedo]|uniref:uncharacterized protein n=1 Tax=Mucor mucedo TaxID=29922 RepID=UPI00221F906D|nr:uncharacterized protein EV154DRAFT_490527 [Mucor mucedo]KAI7897123.1 hypothetical protein EV154DRAFT_490527 [Mucor mucedo]